MRAALGLTLGVRLLLAACATSSTSEEIEIPEVGIGPVPICDPIQEECFSYAYSDTDYYATDDGSASDDIITTLLASELIVAASSLGLGEVLCDRLDVASSSALLRIGISSVETVVAKRTSYSEIDGTAFSNGEQRKIWKGEVTEPAPAAGEAPRTLSMTWTSPCQAESFLLKTITTNLDGTLSFTRSVPCSAGSSSTMCIVTYDADQPPPSEAAESTPNNSTRRLTEETRSASKELTGQHVRGSTPLSRRHLQSNVEVDVMVLYNPVLVFTPIYGVQQMETEIADEISSANEALQNSLVDLQFNLVHVAELPYTVSTRDSSTELPIFRDNEDVKALRNKYQADLVVLVTDFAKEACGRAYFLPNTDAILDEHEGYSVVSSGCLDERAMTHELAHNLGAAHDRNNALPSERTPYGHGLRYCRLEDPLRIRSIMAYDCNWTPGPDDNTELVFWANYFSNPDVNYPYVPGGIPTGADTENVAQTLRDNMVAVSNFRNNFLLYCSTSYVDQTNGTPLCTEGSTLSASNDCGADDECTQEECCIDDPLCSSHTCAAGLVLVPGLLGEFCDRRFCTDQQCCRDEPVILEPTTTPEDYVELGCAADPNPSADGTRLMSVGPIQQDVMSAEICYGICDEQLPGFMYFGTQWSIECFCSMTLRDEVSFDLEHDGCDDTCAGSTDGEICGGDDAITVYQVGDPIPVPEVYEEVGCAEDPKPGPNGGRLMSVGPIQQDTMSAEICFNICEEQLPGFTYFGTQWSTECFCSLTRPNVSSDPEYDGCVDVCAGSTDGEICGGTYALKIYYVIGSEE